MTSTPDLTGSTRSNNISLVLLTRAKAHKGHLFTLRPQQETLFRNTEFKVKDKDLQSLGNPGHLLPLLRDNPKS